MATTKEDIRAWLNEAKEAGATHLIVACDTFDWTDYPISVMPEQDVHAIYNEHNGPNMQRVMEVYNLNHDFNQQLAQSPSMNF